MQVKPYISLQKYQRYYSHISTSFPTRFWAAGSTVRNGIGGLMPCVITCGALGPALLLAPFSLRALCLAPSIFPLCLCFLSSSRRCRWSCNLAPCRAATKQMHILKTMLRNQNKLKLKLDKFLDFWNCLLSFIFAKTGRGKLYQELRRQEVFLL